MSKIKYLFILLFLSIIIKSFGQISLEGKIDGYDNSQIFLASYYGDFKAIIDSTKTDQKGNFNILLPNKTPIGLYKIAFGQGKHLDIFIGKENIKFSTKYFDPSLRIHFIDSPLNTALYRYINALRDANFKTQFLKPILEYYPQNNRFYNETKMEYYGIYNNLNMEIDRILEEYPKTWISTYIRSDRPTAINRKQDYSEQKKQLKLHFLDSIQFNQPSLLNSSLFSNKIISYLAIFQSNENDPHKIKMDFIPAIKDLLERASSNPQVYAFVYSYLIKGFEDNNLDLLVQYIAENFNSPTNLNPEVYKKTEILKNLSMGNTAPSIITKDITGNPFDLNKIKAKYTLLIFWEPNCSSCERYLPEIRKEIFDLYSKKEIQIIGLAISDSKEEVEENIKRFNYPWKNIVLAKAWESKIVEEYAVSGTPKFFLLDRKKRIISQPQSMKEILIYLNE
ncbi:MAG: TlpA family protein disulfide reductase [Bacteroidales bacterium]